MNTTLEEQFQVHYTELAEQVSELENALLLHTTPAEKAVRLLGKLVEQCERKPYANLLQLNLVGVTELCTRIAALYIRVFTDFSHKFTINEVFHLTCQKRFIGYVFEVSGYGSQTHVLKLLKAKAGEKKTQKLTDNPAMLRLLLLATLGDIDTADLVELSLEETEPAALITLGLLLDRLPVTMNGEAARKFLLEEYNPFHALRPIEHYAQIIANVWMLCSYSTAGRKHTIKQHLNDWFKRLHKAKGIAPKPTGSVPQPGNTQHKPVMAVVAESFNSLHAMYRWYAPIIKQLKHDYYMVLVGLKADVDDDAIALFDRYIEVPVDEMNLQPVLNQCTPDIAYFTSVGMRAWGISMANLRWAPLQVMSFGHPASSFSNTMDLAFINTRTVVDTGVVHENMLVLDSEIGSLIEKHKHLKLPEQAVLSDEFVSIAVPCNVMKINLHFIAALKEIERQAEKPVRFMFFPNEFGLGHLSTEKRLKAHFPNAIVARRTSYDQYLALLAQNHLALSPFPFGNATSTIDCMVLGMPVVAWLGEEPHSRSDYDVLAAFGLEDYCVATSVDNYVQGAVRYINTPGLLDELRALVKSKNFMERHVVDENPLAEEFCKALQWAHQHADEVVEPRGAAFWPEGRWK
ncbi:hypothetical protein NQT62_04695 [Limnobacter humi]|uniref:Uncharacterized protein n=1 Tax=Limnobacter humi TaxID=1778671 RepID=A0ABT1WDY4_9BURK|nr:hypothetical protein [Limnobacter humi]MCQ8895740.1 hypothetical protein [Limnobacter humi]